MQDKLEKIKKHYDAVCDEMAKTEIASNQKKFMELAKEQSELKPIVETFDKYKKVAKEIEDSRELAEGDDELAEMAEQELPELEAKLEGFEKELKAMLVPKDPHEGKNIFVEIRAGTGGDEASLFAADLFRMYSRFAERNRWRSEVVSSNETGLGGYKEVILLIQGKDAYRMMRHESGVHRVQRVPQTETQGRIHTSAATVAVLPEVDEVEVDIKDNELRIDVFRSSGPGGQSVNTTDSAVRITHLPTGIVVSCQDEKSQIKNKAKAMKILRARILDQERAKQQASQAAERRTQVGSGDRSERIRTYNYPQNRVTDHRINFTTHSLTEILDGAMSELVSELNAALAAQILMAEEKA